METNSTALSTPLRGHLSIAHVLLGEGVRLFDRLGASSIHLEHIRTLETPVATHLAFRVVK
jgi:hypothetical protein